MTHHSDHEEERPVLHINTQTPIFHQLWHKLRPPYPAGGDFQAVEPPAQDSTEADQNKKEGESDSSHS